MFGRDGPEPMTRGEMDPYSYCFLAGEKAGRHTILEWIDKIRRSKQATTNSVHPGTGKK